MDRAGELLSGGGSALRQARQQRHWSQPQAAAYFVRIAGRLNIAVGAQESVKTALSRWENGKRLPDEANRRVLREMFGLSDTELGLVNDERTAAPGEAYLELSARLRSADGIDDQLVTLLDHHTHELRLLDRRLGAAVLLDKMGAHVEALGGPLTHSVSTSHRAALGRVLADAGALAGWQALDAGAIQRAWTHFENARAAGLQAQHPAVLAHAIGEQAYALTELGRPAQARELIEQAHQVGPLPALLRAWLAAADGEFLAHLGDTDAALRAFDKADTLLPTDTRDDALPYLALDESHLMRWRGSALARLAAPAAIEELTNALTRLDSTFVRAQCGLRTDLAHAYAAAGHRDQAREQARTARQLALQLGSQRLLRRLDTLRLPDTASEHLQQPNE